MIYRKAVLADCEKIYSLMCELEGEELPHETFCEIYREQVNSKRQYCLVAEKDDVILAVLNLRFEGQLHHGEYIAEVMEFVVGAAYRSQGLGKQMFEKAIEIAESYGCAQIELASNQIRKDAHRFYMREGMVRTHYKFSKRLNGEKNEFGCDESLC